MDKGILVLAARVDMKQLMAEAESRRPRAAYDTGSITEAEAVYLLELAERIQAHVVIEVGTFIGTSTTAMASASSVEAVYTCDSSNDCLPSSPVIRTYPKQTSTTMLTDLLRKGVRSDLVFVDGVLCERDVEILMHLTNGQTVYAFHDYNYGPKIRTSKHGTVFMETVPRKGIGNVRLLRPHLPNHKLIDPFEGSTLALLVPEAL